MTMTKTNTKRGVPPRVRTTMDLGDEHSVQILEFASGIRAIVEGGRAIDQAPSLEGKADAPPEAGTQSAGERTGTEEPTLRTTNEQTWFRENFCNAAQACVQGWDWAVVQSGRAVGSGVGIGLVGSEGTSNATLAVDLWECSGTDCYWVENWRGLIVPGHWVSATTTAPDHKYLRWRLDGAGGSTQVSLAAKY
jgi:hypothetical protein